MNTVVDGPAKVFVLFQWRERDDNQVEKSKTGSEKRGRGHRPQEGGDQTKLSAGGVGEPRVTESLEQGQDCAHPDQRRQEGQRPSGGSMLGVPCPSR